MSDAHAFAPIRELIEFCAPGEWGQDPINDEFNCVVYRATDIDNDGHLHLDGGAARNVAPLKIKAKALRAGDLLLEASGGAPDKPVGRVALVDADPQMAALTSNFFRALRPTSRVNANFLCAQLVALNRSSAIWRYQQQTTGLINLKVHDYLEHKVWVPDRGTQDRISSILSGIDTTITQTEALIAKYQQIKAGLMHDLFTRGVLPNGQLRPPREQAPHLYKQTELGWVPSEWAIMSAGNACSLITKGTTPAPHEMWQGAGGVRFLRVDNLTVEGSLNFDASTFRVSPATHTGSLARSRCLPGDVLTNIVGPPLGKVGLVTEATGEVNINQAIALFRPKASLSSALLLKWLTSETAKRWFLQRAKQTSGQVNLTLGMCQALPIPAIPADEQQVLVSRLHRAEELVSVEHAKLTKLKQQKLGLMQDLLTGKVQVPAKPTA